MFITAVIPAVVIGGAIVVVGAAAATIRHLRSRQEPSPRGSSATIEASTIEAAPDWEAAGQDWGSIREAIVHGDPFAFEATGPATFSLTFTNGLGVDAVDVEVEFREFADKFKADGATYRFERLTQGVPQAVAIMNGAAVQGRIPVWATYTIDGDPESERHTIEFSVIAHEG